MKRLLILVARGWQLGPSRILPPSCRYHPSCSAYAIEALEKHGALKGKISSNLNFQIRKILGIYFFSFKLLGKTCYCN